MLDLASPLAVVCHDAGGANLILPWIKTWRGELRACMRGPAAALWANYFPRRPLREDLSSALNGAATLLSGTGWASDLEHSARVLAANRGIRSIAVLDHWVNYLPRFEREGVRQWPDEIWVTDREAEALARGTFPNVPVFRKPNLYFKEQLMRIRPLPERNRILYVLEPVRNDWGRETPGEFQALDYALSKLHCLVAASDLTLTLRLHPSEPGDKYRAYANRCPDIRFDLSPDLADAISDADIVMGVESFALALALDAGRKVFSTLPPWAPPMRLPHPGIVQIRHLHQK